LKLRSFIIALFTLTFLLRGETQSGPNLRFASPTEDTYVSGAVVLRVVIDGESMSSLVEDVTFFADGRQVCVVPGSTPQCKWDAGPQLTEHAFRAVARLKAGGRLVANVRTKDVGYVESVSVDVVLANAVVTDGGRFVKGLTRSDFKIFDDGQERPVTSFQSDEAPLEVVLALDVSASMSTALTDVKEAAQGFLRALRPQDRVTLVAFNNTMFTLSRGVPGVEALPALNKLTAWGATALYDVIVRSLQLLSRQPGKHALVIFSDGDDSSSQATLDQVRRLVADSDAMLMAVGLGRGSSVDDLKEKLESLADASGGRVLFAEKSEQLSESFAKVVEDLINQYTLGFEPQRDGRDHQIRVQVPNRGVRVRARRVYTAPPELPAAK
jgi:Ca-activated chloride channel family protein